MEKWLMISNVLIWVVLIAQTVFLFLMARMVGSFLNRFRVTERHALIHNDLQEGEKAPLFRSFDHQKRMVKLADHGECPTLLLFVKETCSTCHHIVSQLSNFEQTHPNLRIILISSSGRPETEGPLPDRIHFLEDVEIMKQYRIQKVPTMMLIDPSGSIQVIEQLRSTTELNLMVDSLLAA